MLTARTSVDNETEGLAAGADDYVGKPVEPRRLAARVKRLLGRTKKSRAMGPAALNGGVDAVRHEARGADGDEPGPEVREAMP